MDGVICTCLHCGKCKEAPCVYTAFAQLCVRAKSSKNKDVYGLRVGRNSFVSNINYLLVRPAAMFRSDSILSDASTLVSAQFSVCFGFLQLHRGERSDYVNAANKTIPRIVVVDARGQSLVQSLGKPLGETAPNP